VAEQKPTLAENAALGMGVCPKCGAMPNEPCVYERSVTRPWGVERKKVQAYPHHGRVAIGNRR
jgi:hypothetical protein